MSQRRKTLAAIDVGASAARLEVAEVLDDQSLRVLETLQQPVGLGQEAFGGGKIGRGCINRLIKVLRDFRGVVDFYSPHTIRAVATSAVREAANTDTLLDRVAMTTGFDLEVIDAAEESRLTVEAVRKDCRDILAGDQPVLVSEVGAGSTLVIIVRGGEVYDSQSVDLGSVRLPQIMGTRSEPQRRAAMVLSQQIRNVISSFKSQLPLEQCGGLVALGGEARLVAGLLGPKDSGRLPSVPLKRLQELVDRCASSAPVRLAAQLGIPYTESEALLPALLVYLELLKASSADRIMISRGNMRDGLLLDMAASAHGGENRWEEAILHSASSLARKYQVDPIHSKKVAGMAVDLFDQIEKIHRLGRRKRLLLEVAAILHECGAFISSRSHHKHSFYVLAHSEIFGLTRNERHMVAHIARYHRRALPKPSHLEYMALPRRDRILVTKLAAILRVADALDRVHAGERPDLQVQIREDTLEIYIGTTADLTLEQRAMDEKALLFEDAYGLRVVLARAGNGSDSIRPDPRAEASPERHPIVRGAEESADMEWEEGMDGEVPQDSELFLNRELSWLDFNRRVLNLAQRRDTPPMERVKFLAITASNADEFHMVRVGGLMDLVEAGRTGPDPAGLTPQEQLGLIADSDSRQYSSMYSTYGSVMEELEPHGLTILSRRDLSPADRKYLARSFSQELEMVLSPLALDGEAPPPLLPALQVICIFDVSSRAGSSLVAVPIPSAHGRFVRLPGEEDRLLPVEQLVADNASRLFPECSIEEVATIRITRNAEVELREDEAPNLMTEVERMVRHRRRRAPVCLEVEGSVSEGMMERLGRALQLEAALVHHCPGPVGLADLFELLSLGGYSSLRDPEWPPQRSAALPSGSDLWEVLSGGDVMLFHPYESFAHVVEMLEAASGDPEVLAIKQTLYRTGSDSPIIAALERAAHAGKQVTVLVELKARFDEKRNVDWARRLEDAGCNVVYGVAGLKTHAKALLVVRRESGRIARYAHLSTGNYNAGTARIYSDIGLLTSDEDICSDVGALFNMLTGISEPVSWRALTIAPTDLRRRMEELIERERELSTEERPGLIMAKMNSLEDSGMIRALARAAAAGVRVDLNVRGICCLRPSEGEGRLRVISILDRFLEHARVYYFGNAGSPELYIASADIMGRNLDRRVELMIPVLQPNIRERIVEALRIYMADNVNAWELCADGKWSTVEGSGSTVRAQEELYRRAVDCNRTSEGRFRPRKG